MNCELTISQRSRMGGARRLVGAALAFLLVAPFSGCGVAARMRAFSSLQDGRHALRADDLPRARVALTESLSHRPEYVAAWYAYGMLALESEQTQSAVEIFTEVLRRSPRHYRAAHQLGVAELRLGRLDEAGAAFRFALNLDAGHTPSYYGLGLVYEQQGRVDLARRCYLRAYRELADWPQLRERIERLDRSV